MTEDGGGMYTLDSLDSNNLTAQAIKMPATTVTKWLTVILKKYSDG
ncbi:MAG: hypothetical protein HY080_11920 [Gammaproteobacteria bacterium]|nr:hypothetical protein [Gammaproteobacteria bacterium]